MSASLWGAVLGAAAAAGVLLIAARILVIRRPQLALRVLPYVRDLPQVGRTPSLKVTSSSPTVAAAGIFGPFLRSTADLVEKVLGGATSVRRRLERAAIPKTVHEFRIEQVLWGLAGFGLVAAYSLLKALSGSVAPITSLLLCGLGFVLGVMARDNRLSSQATNRERQIITEFPTVAELLALAVAAGESPVAALDRVVRRSGGELSADLSRVLADIRTGTPVAAGFDRLPPP
ncbi:type II secretion system F family protein, partial [Nocardioides sp. CF8]|uniref:type II secretion system F family protein n=1 Tax=Nocardioides sp. CF8 TaxID=110319 RepID=UPI0005609995